MKEEKLTGFCLGLALFAGWTGFACSQQTGDTVEIGTTQLELRTELTLPETPELAEERSGSLNLSVNPMPEVQHIALPRQDNNSQDPAYNKVKRYEFLPALLKDSKTRKSIAQKSNTHAQSWTQAEKNWMLSGKGFGVADVETAPTRTVHVDDARYYIPAAVFKPDSKAPPTPAPVSAPFKSGKPLIFHSRATGFAHEPTVEALLTRQTPAFETQLELSPIPETRVYLSAQPKTRVTLVPAENRLDLMKGNKNLNRDRFDKLP